MKWERRAGHGIGRKLLYSRLIVVGRFPARNELQLAYECSCGAAFRRRDKTIGGPVVV